MYIQTLFLLNFRRFIDKKISFHPQFNVLIGENGSGKTTVLDAIGQFLYHEIKDIEKQITSFWGSKQDIRIGQKAYNNTLIIKGTKEYKLNYRKDEVGVGNGTTFFSDEIEKVENKPIFVHYPSHRQFYNVFLDENKQEVASQIPLEYQCYKNAFSFSHTRFEDFLNWMAEEERDEAVEKVRQKDLNLSSPKLEVVRNAFKLFLPLVMDTPLSNLRTERNNLINGVEHLSFYGVKPLVLVVDKDDISLHINQLSSGEQNMLLFVCDIVKRLTLANPTLANPLLGKGIVLIDEIDLHLHPNWQKNIVLAFKQTFPNIQFIVTTHSPLVIQDMKKEEIVFLNESSSFEPQLLTPDSILTRIQGLQDIETEERKKKLDELAHIDIAMQNLKKIGKQNSPEIQTLWTSFREIATSLDWHF